MGRPRTDTRAHRLLRQSAHRKCGELGCQAQAAGWTVASDAHPHSIVVFSSALVGGVGHVAWVDAVNGRDITITEMNTGTGATVANGYRTTGFHEFDTRTVEAVPGLSYILIP